MKVNMGANQPVLCLFGAVLHSRPPLLHLDHQVLKQPLLVLEGLPHLHHPECPRKPTVSGFINSVFGQEKNQNEILFPQGQSHYAGDLSGSYCSNASQETKSHECIMRSEAGQGW